MPDIAAVSFERNKDTKTSKKKRRSISDSFQYKYVSIIFMVSFVNLYLFSDCSNPNIVQERRRELFSRTYPNQSQFSASDSLDEQLLQTKQWLLKRTLNLQYWVVGCVFICGVVPAFYSHFLQLITTST